jgi:4-hydroxy-tetrahydrodipicolinate reductase
MGKLVAHIAEDRGHQIVPTAEDADAYIDFSVADAVLRHVEEACLKRKPIVIGTTGWEKDMQAARQLVEKNKSAALYASNFSLGIAHFRALLKEARHLLAGFEAAGFEIHHNQKKDAPSGTAKSIACDLETPPFSSLRLGSIIGQHEVVFDSPYETITIKHSAKNREGFALGAVHAAEWIHEKKGWLTLDDMLHSSDYSVQ